MCQLPSVTLDSAAESSCRDAALVYSAEGNLAHDIPTTFACYTASALQGGQFSNIALGNHGVGAVDAFISDEGPFNQAVGHRRWKIYPRLQSIATGDVGASGSCPGCKANAIAVTCSGCIGSSRPTTPDDLVLWPSAVSLFFNCNCSTLTLMPRATSL